MNYYFIIHYQDPRNEIRVYGLRIKIGPWIVGPSVPIKPTPASPTGINDSKEESRSPESTSGNAKNVGGPVSVL